jgi:hypothetical protein
VKQTKLNNQRKLEMKKLNIMFGIILLVHGCFAFSPAAKAEPAIVGLWDVQLFLDPGHTQLFAETYKQWHSDRLEIESPSFSPGQCQGTWKQISHNTVQLYHVGFTQGNPPGTYRFVETETDTVSSDRNSYAGTGEQTFYDENGNQVGDPILLYIQATRISVQG